MISRRWLWPLLMILTVGGVSSAPLSYPLFFEPLGEPGQYAVRGKSFRAQVRPSGIDVQTGTGRIPIRWHNAQPTVVTPLDVQEGVSNYLIGAEAKQWRTKVPHFSKLQWQSIYPGTDLVLYSNKGLLEFDVVLQPQANAAVFEMDFGDASVRLEADGQLRISPELLLKRPFAYQQIAGLGCPITASFERRQRNRYGFTIGSYDRSLPLVIDPTLTFSSYFGGSLADQINTVAADNAGNVYIAGSTTSTDLNGATRSTNFGSQDVFVAKLNSTGTAVIYATYIGGSGLEAANGMAVDDSGTVYLTGQTASTNFPVSANAPQRQLNGGSGITDAFALRLNATGDALIYSTFLGGQLSDAGNAIAVDAQGNAFVAGTTQSLSFPAATNADFPARGGGDAFLTKISADGSQFLYSIFLGGFAFDAAYGVALDARGSVYVVGETRSNNFPVSAAAYQKDRKGNSDAFVSKFTTSGDLEYSTYFGGDAGDLARAIAVDSQGNAYFTGQTYSSNFPTTPNSPQPVALFAPDAFASKLNATGTGLIYSTYIGGSADDAGYAIALDSQNNAYVAGETSSVDFPIRGDAAGPGFANAGGSDAFVVKVNFNGTGFPFASQLGGTGSDGARGVAVNAGRIYIGGSTSSSNFRTTPGALGLLGAGESDGFIARFSEVTLAMQPLTATLGPGEKVQFSATILNAGNPGIRWTVFPAVGSIDSNGLYAAPSVILQAQTLVVTATSILDPLKFAESIVTLSPVGNVTVAPAAVFLSIGETQQFTATLANSASRPSVTWSISPNVGTISASGLYTVPASIDVLTTVTVKAALVSDISRFGTALITVVPNFPQVTAAGLANAASYAALGNGVSPGLIVTLFGTGLGPQIPASAQLNSQGRIDTVLETTRVLFDGVPAPMIATSSGQISAIVPYSIANSVSTQMQVEYQGRKSVVVPFPVVPTSPGLFTANASGRGQTASLNEDGSYNSTTNPAARGSIVVLYATGEGKTTPDGVDGKLTDSKLPKPQAAVNVTVGGVEAEVIYVGGAPGLTAGLLQINIRVPLGSTPSGSAPVIVKIGSASSQIGATIATR